MDVFNAFPDAIITGVWQIAAHQRGTLVGNVFDAENAVDLDVIVDEANQSDINIAPGAQSLEADLLLYVRPEQLPTVNTRALVAGYLLHDSTHGDYFAIVHAGVGKNQQTGQVEHIELLVRQTEVVE